ncbi:hypothetical Protein YC6258_04865 [Gynuella sunshinyii YC6258]|uniref:Uncharacterized protein n=1 Tax=Gynuella sunshinyii YC6258 TaxID=1445510 RepID=A0A0C5VRN4_9GAMM|nr:hypothetical Protein YC6258_04865 [Gynuella sunshinyii YC6258]
MRVSDRHNANILSCPIISGRSGRDLRLLSDNYSCQGG